MKIVEFTAPLGLDNRRRHRNVRVKKKIIEFMVQYETKIGDEWYPVIRYDTAHGFAHVDKLSPDGRIEKKKLNFTNFKDALNYAVEDININWRKYKQKFLEEIK